MTSSRWFVVQCQPMRETLAARQLRNQDFEVFLPTYVKTVRHARKFVLRQSAFFPSYLFVRLSVDRAQWRAVNGTIGVRSLISMGDSPAPVPEGLVEALVHDSDPEGSMQLGSDIAVGERVRLLSGPFVGLVGELRQMSGESRVRILLDLLDGHLLVSIDRRAVVRAS